MIRINQIKLDIKESEENLQRKIYKLLRLLPGDSFTYTIAKKSVDARKKDQLMYIYSVNVTLTNKNEAAVVAKLNNNNIMLTEPVNYTFPAATGTAKKIAIAGSGPAGLFCALFLARAGFKPVVYERGAAVEERTLKVDAFWDTGVLDLQTNVQFGEGGAGTFSDGKLNTVVKEKFGRIQKTLETFVEFGAPAEILYTNKPHIGTDILSKVVLNIRKEIIRLGGEVFFHSQITDLIFEKGRLKGVKLNHQTEEDCDALVLAIGHSARDTFSMLLKDQIAMETKPFAVGLRVEHPQSLINTYAYGAPDPGQLPVADYKVTANSRSTQGGKDRGVYSFCMCPGGYVVNASSEEGMLCVNGMSYSRRDGKNANSAIIVSVDPQDFAGDEVLKGMYFQQDLERKAYAAAMGKVPVQLLEDFKKGQKSVSFGEVLPQIKGSFAPGDLRTVLPEFISEAIVNGMGSFGRSIPGFDRGDVLFSGVESRTSSPVRILRGENMRSISHPDLFPCGEGAGYAGGITSAAVDGIKTAEAIAAGL